MAIPGKISYFFKTVFVKVTDFFKSMINSVIKLVNKIPGINIPLLETSSMKEEKEKKEKNKRIKDATAEGEMAAAVTQTNVSDFDDDTAKIQKAKGYEDGLATDSIYYGDVAKGGNLGIKSSIETKGRMGLYAKSGDASIAERLSTAQAESNEMGGGKPVIINNLANQSNVSSNGAVVSGFVNNKNVDDTFLNLSSASA